MSAPPAPSAAAASTTATTQEATPAPNATCTTAVAIPDILPIRKLNVDPSSIRDKHKQKSLKSDMKKATTFGKKMRTFLNEKDLATINKDLDTFSLGMFATEAAQHTAGGLGVGGESKLKAEDTFLLVEAISNIHQRYEKFQPELETKMDEAFKPVLETSLKEMKEKFSFQQQQAASQTASSGPAGATTTATDELTSSQIALVQSQERARVFVKIASELVAVSILPPNLLVDNLLTPMSDVLAKNATFHHTSQSLTLLNTVVKLCGIEITNGKIPGHPSLSPEMAKSRIDAAKIRGMEKYPPDVGTPSNSEKILDLLKTLISSSCGLCGKLKTAVEKQWKALCEKRELQGEDSAAMSTFKKVKDEVETLISLTTQLATAIGDEESAVKPLDLTIQRKTSDGAGVVISSKMGDFFSVRDAEQQSRFDDDEQAQFYEGVPLFDHLVPQDMLAAGNNCSNNALGLISEEMMKEEEEPAVPEAVMIHYEEVDEHIESLQHNCVAISYADAWTSRFLKISAKLFPKSVFANPNVLEEEDENEKNLRGFDNKPKKNNDDDEEGEEALAKKKQQQQQQKTPLHIAKTFYQNCRRRLMFELRYIRGNALEMIPFYARVVASLSRIFKDIGDWLTLKFENDSLYVTDKAVQNSYTRRMRNARFLAELTKFRVAPPGRVLRVMNKLTEELDKETVNVEVLASLFDAVGPFLARGGVTAEKLTKTVADAKNRMTMVTNVPEHLIDRMTDAFSRVARANRPRAAAVAVKIKIRSPLEEYLRHLLFKDLEPHRSGFVFDQVLKFPWVLNTSPNLKPEVRAEQMANYKMMICTLRDASACRWDRLYLLARVTARLSQYHRHVGLNVVDLLLEDIRTDLEYPLYRTQQQRLQDLKFLGELFVVKMVQPVVFLYVLAQLVLYFPHQHSDTKMTAAGSSSSTGGDKNVFSRSRLTHAFRVDYTRIRAICTLLEASQFAEFCSESVDLISPKILHLAKKILLHFFLLIHQKELPLPHDLDFKLADLLEKLQKSLNRSLNTKNTPSFLLKCFFKLTFPTNIAQAEEFVLEKAQWNTTDGFEKLLHQLQKVSDSTARQNPGFIAYSLCTSANVPSSFSRPWQAPVIDGVFEENSSSSSMMLSDAFAAAAPSTGSGNNNNNTEQLVISKDARAVGDFGDVEGGAGAPALEDDDDDESSVDNANDSASSSSSSSSSSDIEDEMEKATFSRAGGHWAKMNAVRKRKLEEQRKAARSSNKDDLDYGDSNNVGGGEVDEDNDLDDMLFDIVSESTKEKSKLTGQREKTVEDLFGRVKGMTTKQSSQQQQQTSALMNKMLSGFSDQQKSGATSKQHPSISQSEISSRKLVEQVEKSNNSSSSTSSSSSKNKSAPAPPAPMKMSLLRKSDGNSKNVEAKSIYIPTSSEIAQKSIAAQQQSEQEKKDLVARTVRLAKDADTSVASGANLSTAKKLNSAPAGGRQTTVSRHQQLRGQTGKDLPDDSSESNAADFKMSMRQSGGGGRR